MPFFFFQFLDHLDPFRIQEDYPSGGQDNSETRVTSSGNPGRNISPARSPRSCPVGVSEFPLINKNALDIARDLVIASELPLYPYCW